MVVLHEVLEGLVPGIGYVLLFLHRAFHGEYALEEVGCPTQGLLLLEDGHGGAPFRRRNGGGKADAPEPMTAISAPWLSFIAF